MKYCLIGEKLSHSYSCEIHKSNGLNYSLQQVEKGLLDSFVKDNDFDGYNVTIPYKSLIMPLLDGVSDMAKEIGAVNTIVKKDGKNYGYNTDYYGLEFAFNYYKLKVKNKIVTILGSGGTAKTIEYFCKRNGAKKINIVSRKGEIYYTNIYQKCSDTQLLINATPVGMFPKNNELVVDLEKFKCIEFVFDCIYNPLKTELLLEAERLKIKNENGLLMLVAQAFYSQQIWQLNKVEKKEILACYCKLLKEKTNIVFYGMPSSGKTTLGENLAKKLNREFFDSDIEFEKMFNITPKEYIEQFGENSFREKESQVARILSNKSGVVISVGGGAVLIDKNVYSLKQNGILIQVKRKLKLLDKKDRPILQQYGAKKLYSIRKNLYKKISKICVYNNRSIERCLNGAFKKYESTCYKWRKP